MSIQAIDQGSNHTAVFPNKLHVAKSILRINLIKTPKSFTAPHGLLPRAYEPAAAH